MRFQHVKWAFDLPLSSSSEKLVLVLMASHADDEGFCYPSIAYITARTQLNRKTVIKNIAQLIKAGHIRDTGRRVGARGKTKLYQIRVTETHQDGEQKSTKNGTDSGADTPTKLSTNGTKNGTNENGKSTKNGTNENDKSTKNGTNENDKSTNFGTSEWYQKRYSDYLNINYKNINPQLDISTWRLWITFLFDNHPQQLDTDVSVLANQVAAYGDRQNVVVQHAIDKNWKHLHPST